MAERHTRRDSQGQVGRVARAGGAFALVALAASTAFAQDSVSRNANGGNGLPGDALSPWLTGLQRVNYVLDLTPMSSASGTPFGVGPLLKGARTSAARFSSLNGPATISPDVLTGVPAWATTYRLWTQRGGGLNVTENSTSLATNVAPPAGATSTFAAAVLEYEEVSVVISSVATPVFFNHIVAAHATFDPQEPSRLYVSRVIAASNAPGDTSADRSQLGLGAIDARGQVTFRADGFGVAGTTDVVTGNHIFRTDIPARTNVVNLVSSLGATNASTRLINADPITIAVPTSIPASALGQTGTTPMALAPSLAGDLRIETVPAATTSTTLHLSGAFDHRGTPGVGLRGLAPGTVASLATIVEPTSTANAPGSVVISGVTPSRQVVAGRLLTPPATIASTCDATSWNLEPTSPGAGFRHYDSQTVFRGGSGQIAINADADGFARVAGVVSRGGQGFGDNPVNALVVARFDPAAPTSPVAWALVASVDPSLPPGSAGTALRGDYGADGAPGTLDTGEGDGVVDAQDAPIGRLATLAEAAPFFVGPSISAPAMDAGGSIYFLASVLLKQRVGPSVVDVPSIALVRAVPSSASSLCHTLDVVLHEGQVFPGQNSARPYRIDQLNLGDADSISAASLWSSSATSAPWNGIANATLPPSDPRHLGGLVLCARITYDTDQDGDFADPTAISGTPDAASADEAYHVVLYVGNRLTAPDTGPTCPPCPADFDQDGGVTGADVEAFFLAFEAGEACGDTDQDGGITGADVEAFFIAFEAGGC
jgi:hypothetical protein